MRFPTLAAATALGVAATGALGAISNTATLGNQAITEAVGVNWA